MIKTRPNVKFPLFQKKAGLVSRNILHPQKNRSTLGRLLPLYSSQNSIDGGALFTGFFKEENGRMSFFSGHNTIAGLSNVGFHCLIRCRSRDGQERHALDDHHECLKITGVTLILALVPEQLSLDFSLLLI